MALRYAGRFAHHFREAKFKVGDKVLYDSGQHTDYTVWDTKRKDGEITYELEHIPSKSTVSNVPESKLRKAKQIVESIKLIDYPTHDRLIRLYLEGGSGSGDFEHAGRPGEVGGSVGSLAADIKKYIAGRSETTQKQVLKKFSNRNEVEVKQAMTHLVLNDEIGLYQGRGLAGSGNHRFTYKYFVKEAMTEGGEGSGNHGHAGRPGEVGGSANSDEDYRGSHEAPDHENGAPMHDLKDIFPNDLYSSNGFRYYGDFGMDGDYEAYSTAVRMRYRPGAFVKVYRAVPKDVPKGTKINKGDWVGITRSYAKDHGEGALNGNYRILSATVRPRDLYNDGNSLQEWGYDPQPYDGAEERRYKALRTKTESMREGGEGSGNHGHAGRPGEVGGSASSGRSYPAGTYWHGSPSGDFGGAQGIHVGTLQAAREALNARIGVPVQGDWDGTRVYGKTLLCGTDTLKQRDEQNGTFTRTGYSGGSDSPKEDHYPDGRAKYSNGQQVPMDAKPNLFPVRIVGKMTNSTYSPLSDTKANASIKAQLARGTARNGYFYTNNGEDVGSISAVVPSGEHLLRVDRVSGIREGGEGSGNHGHAGRPGEVGGSAPSTAGKAARDTAKNSGTSISTTGEHPTSGYMVALRGYEFVANVSSSNVSKLRTIYKQYQEHHTDVLQGRYIGGWYEDGKLYLDVSENIADRTEALNRAFDNDQIALYHIDKGESVYTMSDLKRPSESKGERIRESSQVAARPRVYLAPNVSPKRAIAKILKAAQIK